MKNLSIKILFMCLLACVLAVYVSAQCVDDEKKKDKYVSTMIEKKHQDSLKFLNEEIKKNPNCFWFYIKRGGYYFVEGAYSSGTSDEILAAYRTAFAEYRKAIELAPLTTSKYWDREKKYFLGTNADIGKVEEDTAKLGSNANKNQRNQLCIDANSLAIEIRESNKNNNYGDYLLGRGDCYYNSKQYESASADYLRYLESDEARNGSRSVNVVNALLKLSDLPHPEKFRLLGCRLKLKNEDFNGAIEDCKEALKIDPTLTEANQLIAEVKKTANQKAIAIANQKAEDEEKEKRRLAEDAEKKRLIKENMKKSDPTKYELYRRAIEDRDLDATLEIMAQRGGSFSCSSCKTWKDDYSMRQIEHTIGTPTLVIVKDGSQYMAAIRVAITSTFHYENYMYGGSEGSTKVETIESGYSGNYGTLFNISKNGSTLNLYATSGGVTYEGALDQKRIAEYRKSCNSCVDIRTFTYAARMASEEFQAANRIELYLTWDGEAGAVVYDRRGNVFRF